MPLDLFALRHKQHKDHAAQQTSGFILAFLLPCFWEANVPSGLRKLSHYPPGCAGW